MCQINIFFIFLQLFLLEERREKKFDYYARVLQKAFRKYFNQQKFIREKEEAAGNRTGFMSLFLLILVILLKFVDRC